EPVTQVIEPVAPPPGQTRAEILKRLGLKDESGEGAAAAGLAAGGGLSSLTLGAPDLRSKSTAVALVALASFAALWVVVFGNRGSPATGDKVKISKQRGTEASNTTGPAASGGSPVSNNGGGGSVVSGSETGTPPSGAAPGGSGGGSSGGSGASQGGGSSPP